MQPTRTITIVVRGGNDYGVHEGERYADRLCWEEMLGEIASLTHPAIGKSRFGMHQPEFYQEREDRSRAMWQRTEIQRPADEIDALERFVNEWGRRAVGAEDALLPPQQQSSVIRSAMETLAVAKRTSNPTTTEEP